MPTKGTYGFYEKLQPLEPTTVVDKAAERENKRRALDIAEADRKAKEKEANKTNFKYNPEDWTKNRYNFGKVAEKINSTYAKLAVAINESDMPSWDKAGYIEQLNSNPDHLIRLFSEVYDFGQKLTDPDAIAELSVEKANNFKSRVEGFMNGNFDVRFNDDYSMDIVRFDDDGNEEVVSLMDYYKEVEDMKDEFDQAIAETGNWAKITSTTEFNRPEKMWNYRTDSVRPLKELYSTYELAFRQVYGDSLGDKELDRQIKAMYERDSKVSKPMVETDDGGATDKDEAKWQWKPEQLDIKADETGASSGVLYNKGTKGEGYISISENNGTTIYGKPTNIKYDANGNLVSFSMIAADRAKLQEALAAGKFDGIDVTTDIQAAQLLAGATLRVFNKDELNQDSDVWKQNRQTLNTEFAKLRETLTEEAKKKALQVPFKSTLPAKDAGYTLGDYQY